MRRRSIVIIIIILILAGAGAALYWAVRHQKPVVVLAPPSGPSMTQIFDQAPVSAVSAYDGSAIWYFDSDGQLKRILGDGTGLTEYPLPALNAKFQSALWPKTGSDFIAFAQGVKKYYQSSSQTYIDLPANIQWLDWMPDGQRVIYIWKSADGQHQSLVVANADGTGFKTIADVFWPDLIVKAAPDGQHALLYRPQATDGANNIYLVDLTTGAITTTVGQGNNTGAMWVSPTKFIFMQTQSAAYPRLYLQDITTGAAADLKLNTTLDKVVLDESGQYLYAAVADPATSHDSFVRVNLADLSQSDYFKPTDEIHTTDLLLLGSTVYFTNSRDGKFYRIAN